ncbi:MAG: DUF4097 family beta strand repeat-containing protein [Acidobacteriota bacterium]
MSPLPPRSISAAPAWIALVVLLLCAPAWATEEDPYPNWSIEKQRWEGNLGTDRVLIVHNPHGDVRCRRTGDDVVTASAVVQRHGEDPRTAQLAGVERDGRIHVTAHFQTAPQAGIDATEVTGDMEKRRMDLTVMVPENVRLEIRTERGLIEAKGLRADLEAHTERGRVVIKNTGRVRAHSDHGEVEVTLGTTEVEEPIELDTLTGDISVWLPDDAGVTVDAESSGFLTTDYSVDVTRRADGHKRVLARIGDGEARLVIRSTNGQIRLFHGP